jgi:hypothetical protein
VEPNPGTPSNNLAREALFDFRHSSKTCLTLYSMRRFEYNEFWTLIL